jgi:hypothetical protein
MQSSVMAVSPIRTTFVGFVSYGRVRQKKSLRQRLPGTWGQAGSDIGGKRQIDAPLRVAYDAERSRLRS